MESRQWTERDLQSFLDAAPRVSDREIEDFLLTVPLVYEKEKLFWALNTMLSTLDLTSLGTTDTTDDVRALLVNARNPDGSDPFCPRPAAVCVNLDAVPEAVSLRSELSTQTRIACVAGGFPSGRIPAELTLNEVKWALSSGADEVDMVLNRSSLIKADYFDVFKLVKSAKEITNAEGATLKVILETSDLLSNDMIFVSSMAVAAAGADFVKSSTGKHGPVSPAAFVSMVRGVSHVKEKLGHVVGVKASGGVKSVGQALQFMAIADSLMDTGFIMQKTFRIGASTLLSDIVNRRRLFLVEAKKQTSSLITPV